MERCVTYCNRTVYIRPCRIEPSTYAADLFGTVPVEDRLVGVVVAVDGFEVQISQLLNAAKAAASAADQARAVGPGAGLDAIATALPGGVAASSAPTLASTFNERAKVWAGEIDRWSESVTSAAKAYSESEDAARSAFG